MTNEPTDTGESLQHHPLPRKTPIGRTFGSISYPAEEEAEKVEDLRKRPSVKIMHVSGEHWMDQPSRSTGARRSIS
ncbi:MAG: hypothetical protein ABI664_08055 [bacterium]